MMYTCEGFYFTQESDLEKFRNQYELRYGSLPDYDTFVKPPTRELHWGWIEVCEGYATLSKTQCWLWSDEVGTEHDTNGYKVRYIK